MTSSHFCSSGIETEILTSIFFAYVNAEALKCCVIIECAEMEVDEMGDAAPRIHIEDLATPQKKLVP
jgi:hypothetical protein